MALVHALVEIDAGDTPAYASPAEKAAQAAREQAAANRIFGLLSPDQGGRLRALFEEFEARLTPEARFARALWEEIDRRLTEAESQRFFVTAGASR